MIGRRRSKISLVDEKEREALHHAKHDVVVKGYEEKERS